MTGIGNTKAFFSVAIITLLLALSLAGCIGDESKDQEGSGDKAPSDSSNPYNNTVKYEATWESTDSHPLPQWFDDAKFGIFIHYGIYSVPAWAPIEPNRLMGQSIASDPFLGGINYAAWYWEWLNVPGGPYWEHHLMTYGVNFNYDDFIPMITASEYNASEWIELFKDSGAKYFVYTSKHHEGYAWWPTNYSNRNSVYLSPHRDVLGELVDAAREDGTLKVGIYYSLYEWFNPAYKEVQLFYPVATNLGTGPHNPYTLLPVNYTGYIPINDYKNDYMMPQFKELVDLYDPDIMWVDGAWDHNSDWWGSPEMISYFYNHAASDGKEVVVNDRWGQEHLVSSFGGSDLVTSHGDFTTPEYSQNTQITERKWEACRGIGRAFAYNMAETELDFLGEDELIDMLVDIVSKNGNLCLSIGPTEAGNFVEPRMERLRAMGDWLDVNGEAIYGTHYYTTAEDGPTVRYTTKNGTLYAIAMEWPGETLTLVNTTASPGTTIRMLGVDRDLEWSQDSEGLHITCPARSEATCNYAYSFRISQNS